MPNSLDEIDFKIIKSISEDCRKTTTQVAKEAAISRPTAIARLKELAKKQIIDFGAKVNVEKLGWKLAMVSFGTEETEKKKDMIQKLELCPRVLQITQNLAMPQYIALICGETPETLLASIECVRSMIDAKITSWQRVKTIIGETFSLKVLLEKSELTPCGKKCALCVSYQESDCIGCPGTLNYKGTS